MKRMAFTKMVASGNDFVIVDRKPSGSLSMIARRICDRKFGIGADGLLLLEKSKKADIRMRVFNADGSETQMCGNGARCVSLYVGRRNLLIETKAGIIESAISGRNIRIRLTDPKRIKLDIPIKVNNRTLRVNFIDTGVPHTVIFAQGLDKIDVVNLGRQIRFHKRFAPAGTNVDFVEVLSNSSIKLRTYERGVEGETLACGTGSVAAALITAYSLQCLAANKINVHTQSGEILKVYFERAGNNFKNVWLEGKARIVHKGVYYA